MKTVILYVLLMTGPTGHSHELESGLTADACYVMGIRVLKQATGIKYVELECRPMGDEI